MQIQFYDKGTDRWLDGKIVEAKIKRDDEIITAYGDNLNYYRYPGKCMTCGRDDAWKISEAITGGFLILVGISIIAIAVTHIIGLFR